MTSGAIHNRVADFGRRYLVASPFLFGIVIGGKVS